MKLGMGVKRLKTIIPIIKALRTIGEVQPSSLAKLAPITSPEQPTADSIIESTSTCGLVISPTFSNEVIAKDQGNK